MSCSMDIGTFNLVACKRDGKGNFVHFREVNAFIEIPLTEKFLYNMMKKSGEVPLIEDKNTNTAYACGEAAVKMAYTLNNMELKRPMKNGCLNPKEKNAQRIMSSMIYGLLDEVKNDKDGEILYYCIPSNSINEETNVDYHKSVLQSIFNSYRSEKGLRVNAFPINEGLALVYAELESKAYTGLGVSCGGGQINVCYTIYGKEIFKFSIVNSGDWIDEKSAKATGESIAFINQEKMKLDLTIEPENSVLRAIKAHYEIMLDKTAEGIKKGLEEVGNKARSPNGKGIDIVVAGGTSIPKGFDILFAKALNNAKVPMDIASIIRPSDPLYSVARGCCIAAENAND